MNLDKKGQLLLTPGEFTPTDLRFEVIGVFNPGAIHCRDEIILLVRVAEGVTEKRNGFVGSPRSICKNSAINYEIDWLETETGGGSSDYRKPKLKIGGQRLSFISHLELVKLTADGKKVKSIEKHPQLFGINENEEFGIEDPRITKIEDTYYITYVAVSRHMGVNTSLMSTSDFKQFQRHGIIFCWENKDVVLFPEKVNGYFHAFHRPVGNIKLSKLAIQHASSPDLLHWGNHQLVLQAGSSEFASGRIGAGPPPIKTEKGWLTIYHGVRYRNSDDPFGIYTAGVLLTALDAPWKVLAHSKKPFFVADESFEKDGYVQDVVFPTGIVSHESDPDQIQVFYGCSDSNVAMKKISITALLNSLGK